MTRQWDTETLMDMTRAFQPACVIMAATELGVFDVLATEPRTVRETAAALNCDRRGMTILLDALAGLELLSKRDGVYTCVPGVAEVLTSDAADSQVATVRHLATCLRRWDQFARVVKHGQPADREPGIHGADADRDAFIEAMDDVCRRKAPALVAELELPDFAHLLDVGGGPATWTIAFLQRRPAARATLFDLPEVIPIAQRHVAAAELTERVNFVGGDLNTAPLPTGADLAWISAIVHMNSRGQNRDLFRKVHDALKPGGAVLIREVIMDTSRTQPPMGALFAVNMLVATEGGGTFTFDELREDLETAGFGDVQLLHEEPSMSSVLSATKA